MEYQLLTSGISTNNSIERVFANRGIEPSNINHYLHTTRKDILDPSSFVHMERGIEMLLFHLDNNSKIFIQIDPDVDGFSSAAALINYLYEIYPEKVINNISYGLHTGKQHGIILDEIPQNVKLVIYPDSASNDLSEHKILSEQGIDVLILDHHELEYDTLTYTSYACVINNQDGCYTNKTLSGAGVVYKFCQMLDKTLNLNYAEKIIDLATLGIISDMMDLRDFETKAIITLGMNNITNPFFNAFVEKQNYSLKGEVTPFGIAFYIAPYINAVIRIGSQEEKLLLFESMLNHKAYEKIPSTKRGCKGQFETRVEQACRNCTNIKNRQTKARDTSLEIIEDIIQEQDLLKNPILIIQSPRLIEPNLTGLMANQIMGKYQKPVLLLNRYEENDQIVWRGSGRNSTYSKLTDLRSTLFETGLVEYSSGHASAFGISIFDKDIEQFKQIVYNQLNSADLSSCYYVDFIWRSNLVEQEKNTILELGKLNNIWGQGLPQPYVAIEKITVTANNLTLMSPNKNPTLKINLPGNISLIKFRSNQEEYEQLYSKDGCVIINIVGTCNINEWNGNINPQIFVEDYEIISKSAYCF